MSPLKCQFWNLLLHIVFDTISYGYLSVGKDYHMNEHNQKHLTLSNRTYIEQELLQKSTFSSIGKNLHKDPSTISKEVKRYSKTVPAKYSYKCNRFRKILPIFIGVTRFPHKKNTQRLFSPDISYFVENSVITSSSILIYLGYFSSY